MRICIIGAGAYGSYTACVLAEALPGAEIVILELGDRRARSEAEAGLRSSVTDGRYAALSKGRFFGLGGSSRRWGGQLLFFTDNDFAQPDPFLKDVVRLNLKHRPRVLSRFGLKEEAAEPRLGPDLFVKTGVWLGYFKRNLFRALGVARLRGVRVREGCRVTQLLCEGRRITGVRYLTKEGPREERFDHFFLAAGAFESNRLLVASGLTGATDFPFSDHLSQRAFRIVGSTRVGPTDFRFRFRGTSLLTRRLVGEVGGVSFFAHPIFNSEFAFFQDLKRLLFNRQLSLALVASLATQFPQALAFFFNMAVLRRLYVHGNQWYLQLDLENPRGSGRGSLSPELDANGQAGVQVRFAIDERTDASFASARAVVREHLRRNDVEFEELDAPTETSKYEDTYHPFGMYGSACGSVREYFDLFENLLVVNTGILPRAGGINCTAAVFPLIEEYVRVRFSEARNDSSG